MIHATPRPGFSLFLVERYLPASATSRAVDDGLRASRASRELPDDGAEIRYLGSTFVPGDETCYSLFEARSIEAVMRAAERADVAFDRVVEAVTIGPIPGDVARNIEGFTR